MNQVSGQLLNAFTPHEVEEWVNVLKKLPPQEIRGNVCRGVDENNVLNSWFQKTIFSRIKQMFGKDLHLVFGMLLDERKPWGVHTDDYHIKDLTTQKPAISFLIPYSVDNNTQLVTNSRTIVFDQKTQDLHGLKNFPNVDDRENSAMKIYEQHLSHNNIEHVKKLTVGEGQYQWVLGSLIYWDSNYFHDSDNFIANGYTSKQAIVMHTYYQI